MRMDFAEKKKYHDETRREYERYYLPYLLTKYAEAYVVHEAHCMGHIEWQKAQIRMEVVKELILEQMNGGKK